MHILSCLAALIAGASMASAPMTQTYLEAKGPAGPLKATLLARPQGHEPVVLMVPGSGPTDRDGNSPLGVKASTYSLLAEGLAEQGVASVRIDKRGMFASAPAVPDGDDVTIGAYADDVHSWIDAIKQATGTSCV